LQIITKKLFNQTYDLKNFYLILSDIYFLNRGEEKNPWILSLLDNFINIDQLNIGRSLYQNFENDIAKKAQTLKF